MVRESAEAAEAAIADRPDAALVAVAEAALAQGRDALRRTPEMLPVLAQAGVVDSGGTGLLLLLDALLHVIDGRALPEPPADLDAAVGEPDLDALRDHADHAAHGEGHDVSDLRYEVMYFLEAPDDTVAAFKKVWSTIGDSIVVVGGDGLWNCHIHTDDIGAAIEAAVDIGRPRQIRVTDLLEEVEEERWVREGAVKAAAEPEPAPDPVPTAVVAIATGDGVSRIFRSLGVQQIVTGGQTMNPSTQELVAAVEATAADEVVLLPNNKNIIPVAEKVDGAGIEAGPGGPHPGHLRGRGRPHLLRPRGLGRLQRGGDGRGVPVGGRRRGHPRRAGQHLRPGPDRGGRLDRHRPRRHPQRRDRPGRRGRRPARAPCSPTTTRSSP